MPRIGRRLISRCLRPVVRYAARAYIAGEQLSDALAVRKRLATDGLAATLGYWDSERDQPEGTAALYIEALAALAGSGDYLSIKLPALRFSSSAIGQVAAVARAHDIRLHCDSHAIADTPVTQDLVAEMQAAGTRMSVTLPGRWRRSVDDAAWARERGLAVRVVKGQWGDPNDPRRDMRAGFLEVVDRLAGGSAPVAVATHDVPLAAAALQRLAAAGTSHSLELLFGLPRRAALELARARGVAVRVYVPYGAAYLPYALGRLRQNPRIAWWLLKDLVGFGG